MGSGFEFSEHEDPMALLNWLNELSARETATGKYERYIGNMGTLHVNHPHIREFIDAKRYNEMAYFNISVNVTEEFMERAKGGELFRLSNELEVSAAELLQLMAESAWQGGEPGLIFLERMNKDNPLSEMSGYRYTTTPPCAEMGLVKGETCHFGYINLYKFIKRSGSAVMMDYDKLREATRSLTRALDNAIEYSLGNYPVRISADIAQMKRKIGIGICGLADLLIVQKLRYDSEEARRLARDILSFVNYVSKWASVELANERGSCMAMAYPDTNKYLSGHYLEGKYAETMKPTRTVSSDEWRELADTIRSTRKLRNISTTALPPTGRTAILLETSSSIEPLFSLFSSDDSLQNSVLELLSNEFEDARLVGRLCQEAVLNRSFQGLEALPLSIRACLKTAKEISPSGHLKMVADIAGIDGVIDESASKTVNLPQWVTVNDVRDIFIESYNLGLKNISVYRDKTKAAQPENLS